MSEGRNCIDYATLACSSTAVKTLKDATPSITAGATVHRAIITCESQNTRWRPDGTDPTTTEGHLLETGDVLQWMNADYTSLLLSVKFIAAAGTSQLKISYYD
jgi:hypothetical protein